MTPALALRCPSCKRKLEAHSWQDDTRGECRRCSTSFEFVAFPALTASARHIAPQGAEVTEDSVCFFHAQNRAEAVCEGCGRLVCTVCAVPFMGQTLCPVCIAATTKQESTAVAVKGRVLHDSIALGLATLPLLVFFVTIVTAPLALGWVVFAWNKPSSLVRGRGRWRLILATTMALAEIAGWLMVFLSPAAAR